MRRAAPITLALAALAPLVALHAEAPPPAHPASLAVTVTGLHSTRGQLVACLWRDKTGFPSCEKSSTALRQVLPVTGTSMHIAFSGLAPGQYAVTVLHDEDGNGKMKHNFIGMPAEGVGVSNNPGGMPGYAKSLIDIAPGSAISIRMRYLLG
ncbi:MAG: DUF2141 domain-containing protein [Novosphingobium sp.]|nr:DUF2141 domain-containing protein [Novosphingobium sp.]